MNLSITHIHVEPSKALCGEPLKNQTLRYSVYYKNVPYITPPEHSIWEWCTECNEHKDLPLLLLAATDI